MFWLGLIRFVKKHLVLIKAIYFSKARIGKKSVFWIVPEFEFSIGETSFLADYLLLNNKSGAIKIGKNCVIGYFNTLIGPITIGNNAMTSQNVVLSAINHQYENIDLPPIKQECKVKKISIADNAWIGANSVVLCGVSIGKHSIIGAGSVVTKDIPPYSVAVGSPARVIKKYDFNKKEWIKVK